MVYPSYHCRSRYCYYPHIIIITIIQMHLHAQHQTFRAEFLNLSSSVDCVMDLLQEISLTATLWVTNCSGICGFWYQQIRSTLVDPRRPEMAICRHIVVTLHQPTRIRSTAEQLVQHTHTRLMALCPGLPGWASTRKVKPIWILLKQEIVRYDRRCYYNVRSKADISPLNLPHGTNN